MCSCSTFTDVISVMNEWLTDDPSDLANLTDCDTSTCIMLKPEDLQPSRLWIASTEAFSALELLIYAQNVNVNIERDQCSKVPLIVFTHDNDNIDQGGLTCFVNTLTQTDLLFYPIPFCPIDF